jgi:proteasome accessory factor C
MSGPASGRLSRLLALVPWLVANDGITIAECAAHFGVTEDQLESDLWLLVMCGVPGYGPDQLVDIQFWDDGVIHVMDPQTLAKPMRLTHEEALTLLVALRMLAQLPGVEGREAIVTAAAKLEQISSGAASDRFVVIDVPVDAAVTEAVDIALAQDRQLTIVYASASKDEVTTRDIRPRRLLTIDGVSYLEAYCLTAEAYRTFRLDRVLSATPGESMASGSGPLEEAPDDVVVPAVPTGTATVRLAPDARWIIDVHHASVVGEPDSEGFVTATLPLHSLDWGVRLVLSLRGGAIVADPPELARAVARAAEAALSAYPDVVE